MTTIPMTRRRAFGLIGVAALTGSLAACSSASGSSSSPGGATSAGGLTAVTVLRSSGSTFEPLYIAQDQGYFKAAGLDVTITAGAADTSQNVPSVLNGEAQFAMTDSAGFLKAVAKNIPVQAVVQIQGADATAPVSDGTLVPAGSSVTSAKDLAGKNVGLPALGGNIQMITQYAVEKAGGDPKSVKLVALPVASLQDAATKGQVDAISTFATFYEAAKTAGMTPIGNGSNDFPGLPQALVFSSTQWLGQNADTAKKFADALAKGEEYANSHPDDVRAVDTKYTKMAAGDIKSRSIQKFSPAFTVKTVELAAQKMFDYGIVTSKIDTSKALWAQAPQS